MPEPSHHASPHDALIAALEKVDDMHSVLIVYDCKDDARAGSFDSDLTTAECLYLLEIFRHWLLSAVLGQAE